MRIKKKGDIIMKKERKYTWCIRYYDVMSGIISYRVFVDLTVREINRETKDFINFNDNYIVKIFKLYKRF